MEANALVGIFLAVFWTFCCYSTSIIPKISSVILCLIKPENEKCRALRREIRVLVSELNEISAVSEFAKHARKTRELTRSQDQLKAMSSSDSINALKGSIALQAVFYFVTVLAAGLVFKAFYGVPVLVFNSNWFYPLNYAMAWPDLAVSDGKSPVSATFLLFLIGCLARRVKLKYS